jgi:nucleoside-diphosphate-sugar epimerase
MEEAQTGEKITTYRASKTYAERAAWDFVHTHHPDFDVVTLCPPMVYGPVINAQTIANINASNEKLWKFLSGNVKTIEPIGVPLWVDVRDLAQAHLVVYEKKEAGGNRFFIVVFKSGYRRHLQKGEFIPGS